MKNIIKFLVVFVSLSGIIYSQSIPFLPNSFRSLNYQCAGYVTEIIPAKNTSSLSQQVLYAKTDIGGIYKSSNNGSTWGLISNYPLLNNSRAYSEYITAGLAVNPFIESGNELLVAWGNLANDALIRGYQCIWKSVDGGVSWVQSNIPNPPGVLFQGDNFQTKIGGECIIYDPRQNDKVYMGGSNPNGGSPTLFKSTDNGSNFSVVTSFTAANNDVIISIAMNNQRNDMYIGTTNGIYYCPNIDQQLPQFSLIAPTSSMHGTNIARILMKSDGNAFFAFTVDSDHPSQGGSLYKYNVYSNTWTDLTTYFNNNSSTWAYDQNYFCMLAWALNDESILLAGRINNPIKKSTTLGNSWSGEETLNGYENIYLHYDGNNTGSYPNHQYQDEFLSYMYGGLNYLIRNPNYLNTWYASGGAGLRISDNNAPTSGLMLGKTWNYSTFGQSMPVVYDFAFETTSSMLPHVNIPMADWSLAYTFYPDPRMGPMGYYPLEYDNLNTRIGGNSGNTYISNVTRTLISNDDPITGEQVTTYNIGADTYINTTGSAAMYKKVRTSTGTSNCTRINGSSIFSTNNSAIVDGLIYKYTYSSQVNDAMVILVGTKDYQNPPLPSYTGIYWTTDKGVNFTQAFVDGPHTETGLSTTTIAQFSNSIIPSLTVDPQYGYLYSEQFNFAIGNYQNQSNSTNPYLYVYLPGSSGGGMFVSSNGGQNWAGSKNPTADLNPGCLKYLVQNQLLLAIRDQGLFYAYLNSDGSINSWSTNSTYGFNDATQVEVLDNIWVVFGKRSGDQFPRLYKTTNYGVDWKSFADGLRGVRALRINPQTYELFIATTGLGTIIYNDLAPANQPTRIKENRVIAYNTYFERDIEIDSGASLTINNSVSFKMAPGKKIYIKEGGKFNADSVTFNCTDSSQKWEGIYFENSNDSCVVQNCTFNNATLPVKILNDESYTFNKKIIKDNIFNCYNTQEYAIYAENVFSMLVQGNQFNMVSGSTTTVGLEVKNSYNNNSDGMSTNIDIVGNTFSNGCASMVLNSYASELTPFYIYGNTFNGNSVHYNIIGRMITGTIKNNNFSGTNTDNPIYLQQCNPDFFGNIINGNGTTMILNGHSYPNLSPYRTSNTLYWHSGQNKLYSINAGNINIIDAGIPYINCGYNQFSKNSDQSYFHLTGKLDSTVGTFSATRNAWCTSNSNPVNYLYTTGNPSVLTDFNQYYSCNGLPSIQYSSSSTTNKGFGIYDTLFISTDNSNYYIAPDELLNSQASIYFSSSQYLDAINCYKSLVDNYLESQYLSGSLYELFSCYENLDTSSNTTYRDNLYSDLKTFLNNKIQSGNYSSEFIDIAYYLINMCEVNMDNYNDALTGFEFIAMFHPDATMRLLASWDYDEVLSLMGQSGGEKEISSEQFREKLLIKLENAIKKDSTLGIVNRIYKAQNDDINLSYSNESINTTKKVNNSKNSVEKSTKETNKKQNSITIPKEKRNILVQRAENNLRILKSLNKDIKIKKHKEDILLIAGLTSSKNRNNETLSVPMVYSLSQNYPNPFNPVTKINYELPKDGKVKLVIYDILGREIKSLVNNEFKQAGKYTVEFNGTQYASGVYFYRIQVDGGNRYTAVKKMVLIK